MKISAKTMSFIQFKKKPVGRNQHQLYWKLLTTEICIVVLVIQSFSECWILKFYSDLFYDSSKTVMNESFGNIHCCLD